MIRNTSDGFLSVLEQSLFQVSGTEKPKCSKPEQLVLTFQPVPFFVLLNVRVQKSGTCEVA